MRLRFLERRGLSVPGGLVHETLDVAGVERSYWWDPAHVGPPGRAPLLVVLHGAGGQGFGMAALTGLHRRAPAAGFVTVFPDGHKRVWHDARALRRRTNGGDDVGFLQALVAHFTSTGLVRAGDVYLAGISNGALMAEHLARQSWLPDAGMALVAGPGAAYARSLRRIPAQSATVLLFSGTADPLVPYRGGPIGPLGRLLQRRDAGATGRASVAAAETVAADWAAADGFTGEPRVDAPAVAPGDLEVTRLSWHRPDVADSVVLHRIEGGGHTWPGGAQYLPERIVGPVARSLDATAVLLDAFRAREEAASR